MNGILCVDKPAGFTSFDVIAKLRGVTGVRKIGHTGTLDPMATGVLPLLFGRATKACDLLPDETKRYEAGFRFGTETDTQDVTGTVLSTDETPVTEAALSAVLPSLRGAIEQIPPMYSAVRVGGRRLYDLARQGKEVERKPRVVTVFELNLLSYDPGNREGTLEISCSKGTYVRTLIHEIGARLGTGGVMTSLRRTASAGFTLAQCLTLEEVERLSAAGELEQRLLPVETVFRERWEPGTALSAPAPECCGPSEIVHHLPNCCHQTW